MAVDLDSSAMQQLQAEQRALLDTIDELRVLGLGNKFLDLPQLIVVGDQSSGKSSVLEAISRVRFPMKDGVCTRFATELVLRQSPQTKIDVKIQNESLDAFSQTSFGKQDLPRIIEEAKRHMGVGADSNSFSEQVLRVTISGPDVPQLTLVDLPGFYHNETESQGIKGVAIVDRLAEKYMRQENSIILAVISAQNELAAQKVLGEAKKHDPARTRTLGIITKPDKVEEESNNEQMYLRLSQNQEASHKLALGWHVLRNRAQKETDSNDTQRDEEEKRFFQSGVWSTISSQNRGIETLREKLSQVLLGHIQQKLPNLIAKIDAHIRSHQTRLRKLGGPRSSPTEVRKYLTSISTRFQRLALDGISGNYLDPFFGGLFPDSAAASYAHRRIRKIRALVRDMNRAFYHVLLNSGGRRHIRRTIRDHGTSDWEDENNKYDEGDREEEVGAEERSEEHSDAERKHEASAPQYLQPLIALYTVGDPVLISIKDLKEELEKLASENRGVEFPGSANDKVTLSLFRDQSGPWEDISNQHIDQVTELASSFAQELLLHVVGPDSKTADSLSRNCLNPYFDRKKKELHTKLAELLRHYQTGYDPQPLYEDFRSTVERRKNERLVQQVSENLRRSFPELFAKKSKGNLTRGALAQAILNSSKDLKSEFNAEQIIDNMTAYYEMSLKVFANNVVILALENCLISEMPEILTPDKVQDMSDETVISLASESKQIKREREELLDQLAKLQAGFAACQEYRPRRTVDLSPPPPPSSKILLTRPPDSTADGVEGLSTPPFSTTASPHTPAKPDASTVSTKPAQPNFFAQFKSPNVASPVPFSFGNSPAQSSTTNHGLFGSPRTIPTQPTQGTSSPAQSIFPNPPKPVSPFSLATPPISNFSTATGGGSGSR
ncbi:P-loop containing nucleoside triphosphate hydrolase protein [Lasiosphaeria hispida]|uniref:P-loop containing nucleoside triphosphate hydrolase protein n=1 Tax=Lasiosphaeria hispida TaxID=260671 RepID=A0AAJ0HV98_9PEZI|nr:P-loop containing nucleoside triphosphate hydrolase protein [Lasiosphaeria hispida]